jgi:hypothetical protein
LAGAVAIMAVKPTTAISVAEAAKPLSKSANPRVCYPRQFNRRRSLKGMLEVIVALIPAVASIIVAWAE